MTSRLNVIDYNYLLQSQLPNYPSLEEMGLRRCHDVSYRWYEGGPTIDNPDLDHLSLYMIPELADSSAFGLYKRSPFCNQEVRVLLEEFYEDIDFIPVPNDDLYTFLIVGGDLINMPSRARESFLRARIKNWKDI